MTVEQELKLHVQKSSRQAVKEVVNTATAETIHLQAFYFDSCERELAQAGIALRLRKEQDVWVQTIKLPGEDALSKIEYNHPRPGATLDLSIYAGTPAEQAFKQLKSELITRFETDISRTLRLQETAHGVIELAYDTGLIRSGNLTIPVCELEFELKEGSPAAIFTLAEVWQQQHQFILDFRSKAERGDTLASTFLKSQEIDRDFSLWRAWQADYSKNSSLTIEQATQICLEQIARNAAVIAGIDRTDMDVDLCLDLSEHSNQLRSALQKMPLLWSESRDEKKKSVAEEPLLQTLQGFEHALSQASVQQATKIVKNQDFQACLLKILAWTILK